MIVIAIIYKLLLDDPKFLFKKQSFGWKNDLYFSTALSDRGVKNPFSKNGYGYTDKRIS
jgi:hypothetical protein